MLEINNTVAKMQKAFDGLLRLVISEESTSVLEGVSIEISKTEKRREKRKKQNIQRLWDNYKKSKIYVMRIPNGEKNRNSRNI